MLIYCSTAELTTVIQSGVSINPDKLQKIVRYFSFSQQKTPCFLLLNSWIRFLHITRSTGTLINPKYGGIILISSHLDLFRSTSLAAIVLSNFNLFTIRCCLSNTRHWALCGYGSFMVRLTEQVSFKFGESAPVCVLCKPRTHPDHPIFRQPSSQAKVSH